MSSGGSADPLLKTVSTVKLLNMPGKENLKLLSLRSYYLCYYFLLYLHLKIYRNLFEMRESENKFKILNFIIFISFIIYASRISSSWYFFGGRIIFVCLIISQNQVAAEEEEGKKTEVTRVTKEKEQQQLLLKFKFDVL